MSNPSASSVRHASAYRRRVIVVTGAASGIGAATVRRLAEGGDAVVAVDRNREVLDMTGGDVHGHVADVSTAEGIASVTSLGLERFGRLAGFVANAGIAGLGRAEDLEPEAWDRIMAVNVRSVYLAARAMIPLMRATGGGSFVAVASQLGLVGGAAMVAYCASKGAVVNLVRALAIDHSSEGVRVNCVCPGPTHTPMLSATLERIGGGGTASGTTVDAVPLGRVAEADEIAGVIQFLLSPESSFVAGAVWAVDGGYIAR